MMAPAGVEFYERETGQGLAAGSAVLVSLGYKEQPPSRQKTGRARPLGLPFPVSKAEFRKRR